MSTNTKSGSVPPWAWFFLPIAFVIVFMFSQYQNYLAAEEKRAAARIEEQKKAAEKERADKIAWPLPAPPPHPPVEVRRPVVAQLPAVQTVKQQGRTMYVDVTLQERLRVLITEHPVEEIRTDLHALIESGTVAMNFVPDAGNVAAFKVVRREDVLWSSDDMSADTRKNIPAMTFDPQILAELSGESDTLYAQLVIYHEYQHYKHWLADPESPYFLGDAKVAGVTQDGACAFMWEEERSAYQAECQMANTWGGVPQLQSLCDYVDTTEWDHAMLTMLAHQQTFTSNACLKVWAHKAHHPYADLF